MSASVNFVNLISDYPLKKNRFLSTFNFSELAVDKHADVVMIPASLTEKIMCR